MPSGKPSLLIAKGIISRMGGAERDLLRVLPHLTNWYDISVATLSSCQDLESVCDKYGIRLYQPNQPWQPPNTSLSQILDKIHTTSIKAWKSCPNLISDIPKFDYFHVVSGDGYLGFLEMIPYDKKAHLHLLEPHRGYHEDSLHRDLYGNLKRPKILTNILLSKGRKNDLKIVKKFSNRKKSVISGNSSYTSARIKQVYGIDCSYLHPCVDSKEYSDNINGVENPFTNSIEMNYVVTIGTANWAKGTMEVISMLSDSKISVAHVGGGTTESLQILRSHADDNGVELWIAPRLSSQQLSILIQQSLAVVSMAHKEPFGLSPIEAFSIGTPAIFVNDGGFRDSIIDGKCGRLLERNDVKSWHQALSQAKLPEIRKSWTEFGRKRIEELKLSPQQQAEKLHNIFQN